jgi:TctA family transporter
MFSNFEYFWLAVFGMGMSAVVSRGKMRRGLLAAAIGMLLATVGLDIVSGAQRFTFGHPELMGGIGFIPVMIGLFGVSEVIRSVLGGVHNLKSDQLITGEAASPWSAVKDIWKRKLTVLKASVTGTLIGALPGAGADIAAWAAYGIEQRTSRAGKKFGTGETAGIIAPTSANNAAISGAWIPALVFGIPGDAVTAIVLGALMMYEIRPGPLIFEQNPSQIQSIFLIALITQLLLIPCGYLGIRAFGKVMRLPRSMVMVGVLVFSVVGSYSLRNSMFDVYVMACFGLVGFFLESRKVPLAPLILGLILGPMVEDNLRTGLIKSEGSFLPFLTRPICFILVLLLVLTLLSPVILRLVRRSRDASP